MQWPNGLHAEEGPRDVAVMVYMLTQQQEGGKEDYICPALLLGMIAIGKHNKRPAYLPNTPNHRQNID